MDAQRAFTMRYKSKVRVLTSNIGIFLPVTKEEAMKHKPDIKSYTAIWDTGATGTVITKKVADDIGLKPTGVIEMNHAGGKDMQNTYLINIILPNDVVIPGIKVSEGILTGGAEVLIGMDIIGAGDFAVTHVNPDGGTTMSFCMPSCEEIDFIPRSANDQIMKNGNRHARRALQARKNR